MFSAEVNVPSPSQRPPALVQQVSVTASLFNNCPISPPEQYVANRAHLLYDANNQHLKAHNASSTSHAPTTASPNPPSLRTPMTGAFLTQNRGFLMPSTNLDQSPSTGQMNLTPSQFQSVLESNQSSAGYPIEGSSVVRSPIFHSQMSYEQRQQAWRQKQIQKIQKKQRYCYVYSDPGTPAPRDRLINATIVSPQPVFTQRTQQQPPPTPSTGSFIRQPTQSPFSYPPPATRAYTSSVQIENPSPKPNNPPPPVIPPAPPKRMDRVDEDPQESSNADNSTITTSALVHRKDS